MNVVGLEEEGYHLDQFKTAGGGVIMPVEESSREETPIYVQGGAIYADNDLLQVANEIVSASGNRSVKEDYVGFAAMRSEADVGKQLWVRRVNPGEWIGPITVIAAIPNEEYAQWTDQKIAVAVDKNLSQRLGIFKKGGAEDKEKSARVDVEVFNGNKPIDNMEAAQVINSPEIISAPQGSFSSRQGYDWNTNSNRLPSHAKAYSQLGNRALASASSGVSEEEANMQGGRISPQSGGGMYERQQERLAWLTAQRQAQERQQFGEYTDRSTFDWPLGGGVPPGGGDGGGEGGGEGGPEIPRPPHVETTGQNTKIYEIMMTSGMDQAGIQAWADANGYSFEEAIDILFAQFVPTEWKSPWEQHMEASGLPAGTSLEEAWAQIGAGGEDGVVQLYQGEEGTRAHYEHDFAEGLTQLSFAEWAAQRYALGDFEDGGAKAPIDQEAANAANVLLQELQGDETIGTDTASDHDDSWGDDEEYTEVAPRTGPTGQTQQGPSEADLWAQTQGFENMEAFYAWEDPESDTVAVAHDPYVEEPLAEVFEQHMALDPGAPEDTLREEEERRAEEARWEEQKKKLAERAQAWADMEGALW